MDDIQTALCEQYGAKFQPCAPHLKLGIAVATLNQAPINGLRHRPQGDTTGWYVWGGQELSPTEDFFQPLHVVHLEELLRTAVRYLGPWPGWRFQVANCHEDVWFDANLLNDS